MSTKRKLTEVVVHHDEEIRKIVEAIPKLATELSRQSKNEAARHAKENMAVISETLGQASQKLQDGTFSLITQLHTRLSEELLQQQEKRIAQHAQSEARHVAEIKEKALASFSFSSADVKREINAHAQTARSELAEQISRDVKRYLDEMPKQSFADVFVGNWSADRVLKRGDIFGFRGSSYLALIPIRGEPPNSKNQKGPRPNYALIAATGSPGPRGQDGTAGSGVTSITGTANQIVVSAPTGAVILSLPASVVGVNTFTSATNNDISLVAGGTNQNVVLTPSGTGFIRSGTAATTETGGSVAMQFTGNTNNFFQSVLQNTNAGNTASTDLIIYNNQVSGANPTTHYLDLGKNSSAFSGTGPASIASGSYLYEQTDDLSVGVIGNTTLHLFANNADVVQLTGTAVSIPSTVTGGIKVYNTVDQTTNYERLEFLYSSNTAIIRSTASGTATIRPLTIGTLANQIAFRLAGTTAGAIEFDSAATSQAGNIGYNFSQATQSQPSGNNVAFSLTPTYNQVSGSAANTDLKIARTETALGNGAQRFAEFFGGSAGTTSLFSVVNNGHLLLGGLTTDGTGVLQFPAATTSAGGITFGTDVNIYRTAAGTFNVAGNGTFGVGIAGAGIKVDAVTGSSNATLTLNGRNSGTIKSTAIFADQNGQLRIQSFTGQNISLESAGAVALTLDSSQNATFAKQIVSYNGVVTTGWGIAANYATGSVVGATAAGNITNGSYTVGAADGDFLVSGNILVTAAIAVSTSLNVSYTDEGGTARTLIMPISGLAGSFVAGGLATSTGPFESAVLHIRAKAATAITFSVAAGTFTSVVYNARCSIRQIA